MAHIFPVEPRSHRYLRLALLPAILALVSIPWNLAAQVSTSYTFSASSGSYSEISGGTQLWGGFNGTFDDQVSSAQTIPSFNFNGTAYTEMYVSANGFITFGSAPSGTNYTPLSSGESYSGAISAFGADIENRSTSFTTRTVRWQTVGNEVIVQWKNARRQGESEYFDFQIRLNTSTNAIVIVYGPRSTPDNATSNQPQVGLRGANNLLLSNLNNRRVGTGSETWANPLAGNAFSNTMRYTDSSPAKSWSSGQTYSWTACTPPTVSVTPSAPSYCPGGSVALTASGANAYTWSPAAGLSATTGANVTANPTSTSSYTVSGTNTGCAFAGTTNVTVTVLDAPTGVSANSSAASACVNGTVNLTATGSYPGTILSQNFNSGAGGWTTTNSSTGGTPADAAWTLRPNNYFYNASSGSDPTFSSNDGSQFYLSNSDDQGSGGITATTLVSPSFSLVGYTTASLNFYHHYRFNSGASDRAYVDVSTDGTNYTNLVTYSSTQGNWNAFTQANLNLNSYAGQPTVYVRFRYAATYDWWWAVDNVSITGVGSAPLTWGWTSTPSGFTSSVQNPSGVVVTQTRTYTVTATAPNSCTTQATTGTVTAVPAPNAGTNGTVTVCSIDAPVSLFAQLGGTPDGGGIWSGPSPVVGGNYDPATMNPGVYTYTVSAPPCANAQATVTVTENTATTWYADADGDSFGDPGVTQQACAQPPSYVANNSDNCPNAFGLIGSACNDGNACTINDVLDGSCNCVGTFQDTDGDSVCDANDNCPTVPGQIGSACDDNNDCTLNDVLDGSCNCAGTYTDTDGDGTCDGEDGCPTDPNKTWEGICGCGNPDVDGDGDTVMDCLDGCPTDPNKIAPGACGCGTPDTDTDGDATPDCNDLCPMDPNKTAPGTCGCGQAEPGSACNDGNPNTGNDVVNASCQCVGQPLDCAGTPGGPALPGTTCNDGDPNTANDVYDANCVCAGTPTNQVVGLTLNTDANGGQTSWEIIPQGGGAPLCSGSGYPDNATVPLNCPLADGCYELRVMDSFGDGMTTGGYVLRDAGNKRIIDNANDGAFGSVSQIANSGGFCLPLGNDRIRPSRCDLETLLPTDWIAADENPAVDAQFGVGNQADDGYQFWFFNPDGGYSRRVLMTHATNNYLFPWGPGRCSYLRLSNLTTSPLPHNQLLNVRVRSMVNGVYTAFGPACRLKIDLVNQCPTSQLVNDINSNLHSCGITNVVLDGSQYLHTQYVANVVTYQWEFDDINSAYLRRITSSGSALRLSAWATLPLQYNTTYNVRVRVSYDGGANYCPWGTACTITTAPVPPGQGQGRGVTAMIESPVTEFRLWPNPNRGDVVNVLADGLPIEASTADLSITDLFGKQVYNGQVPVADGTVRQVIDLSGRAASGVYLVVLRANEVERIQRLVIE
ncbi:MAG: T9SS type A sorting domain-containing protein [Flavobacteriales bacterium]|nr:T9SS type A sorting domain-containing protein [Flavobacteriales bacterium]